MRRCLPPCRNALRPTSWKRVAALVVSTLTLALPAFAQGISVFVDGTPVSFSGASPVSQGGRVLVPMADVFRALGAFVDWDAATRSVDARRGDTTLRLTLGSATAFVNDQPVRLEVPAQSRLGRTMVPLRFVGEALGATVTYNAAARAIYITAPPLTDVTPPVPTATPTPRPLPTPTPEVIAPTVNTISGTVVKVDTTAPATIRIRSDNRDASYEVARNAILERRPVLSGGTVDNPRYGTTTRLNLASVRIGENVTLELDDANRVSRLTVTPQVYVARVRSATGNRIVLDDARGTVVTVGNQVRFLNAQGREVTTANLQAGDEVVLFVSPDTRLIYQVSAYDPDVNAAYGRPVSDTYIPPDTTGTNADTPEITQVTHNARGALRAGGTITITVRGTPGLRAYADLSNRAINIPLTERANQPGVYTGTYTIRRSDDVFEGRVTARLVGANGEEVTQQSTTDITIDTTPPRVTDTYPRDNDTIDVAQPNITIDADDLGGSGLAPSTITITNNGQTFDVPATVTRRGLRAVSPRALSGRVDVTAEVRDEAGNAVTETFSFTVRGTTTGTGTGTGAGPIRSIYHNANRALQAGDVLTVEMTADEGGRASFDLVDENNRTIVQGIPMTEVSRGRYRGTYTINGTRDTGLLRVVGRFRDANGQLTTLDATTTVEVVGGADLTTPTITSPVENDQVGEEVTIRGRGLPGAIVEVAVRAEGVQYLVIPYSRELGTTQVRVNNNGIWQTGPIALPRPRNISSLRYVIRATQTDNANRTSEETSVTVRPQ